VPTAINSGNSGGPVFNSKGDLAGIAFQALEGAENVGYIVPPPIVLHFLNGVKKDGTGYKGFPELGVVVQTLENPVLRRHLKLKDNQSGILITKVFYHNSGYGSLKEGPSETHKVPFSIFFSQIQLLFVCVCVCFFIIGDVITNIDGYDVANNGTITFDDKLRGVFQLAIHKHFVGPLNLGPPPIAANSLLTFGFRWDN